MLSQDGAMVGERKAVGEENALGTDGQDRLVGG